jgi:hypothetical protein
MGSVDSVSKPIPNRTNGKTDTKTEQGEEEYNKNTLFNTAELIKKENSFMKNMYGYPSWMYFIYKPNKTLMVRMHIRLFP